MEEKSRGIPGRRQVFQLLVLSGLAVVLFAGCVSGTQHSRNSEGGNSSATSIAVGTTSTLGTTNPLDQTWSSYVFAVFDGLLAWGSSEPGLAESWDTDAETRIVFTVRSDALFHDGSPVTAADVAFSINLVDEKKFAFAQNLDSFESVTAEGDQAVVNFNRADPLGLQKIGQIPIVPEAYWGDKGEDGFVSEPVGSGPFRVAGYSPGVNVELEAFGEYWGETAPTEQVDLQFFSDSQALESAFESGQLQVAHGLSSSAVPQLEQHDDFLVSAGYVGGTIMLQMNTTKPPFDDPALRLAANLAIDQSGLITALDFDSSEVEAGQVTYEGVLGFRDDLVEIQQDLDQARRLVKASDYDGSAITLVGLAARKDLFEGLAAGLRDVGFSVEVNTLDVPVWLQEFREGSDADIFQRGVTYQGINDASRAYRWLTWSAKPFVTDPAWVELWERIGSEMDPTQRTKLLEEATGMVYEENYVLFTSSTSSVNATVKGVSGIVWLNPAMDLRQIRWSASPSL